jgi:hypothetical protein
MRYSHVLVGGLVFTAVGCGGEAIAPVDGGTGGFGSQWPSGTGGTDPNEEVEHSNGGTPASGGSTGVAGSGGVLGVAGNGGDGGAVGVAGMPSVGPGVIPLIPADGWLDAATNTLGMQGAVFSYGDAHSLLNGNFTGPNVCIWGEAAQVDLNCIPEPPATDCYGEYWGTAIGMNLNQPIDPVTAMGVEVPLTYDASALAGFSFEVMGALIPTSIRFKVETPSGEFCTPATVPVLPGPNTILFSDLRQECWFIDGQPLGAADIAGLLKISWHVVTNEASPVPFDFCVSNISAVPQFQLRLP